jgi:hypothetical protein
MGSVYKRGNKSMAQANVSMLVNGLNPVKVGGLGVTTKWFPNVPGASINVAGAGYGMLFLPGSSRLNGTQFVVKAVGNIIVPDDSVSPTVNLSLGAVKNPPIQTNPSAQVAQTGFSPALTITKVVDVQHAAAGLGVTPFPWSLVATLNADTDSGLLQGTYSVQIDNGSASTGAITSISGVDMSLDRPLGFIIGVTFSQTSVNNLAKMFQYSIDS